MKRKQKRGIVEVEPPVDQLIQSSDTCNNINLAKKVKTNNKYDCELCDVRITSQSNYEEHINSKKHKTREANPGSYGKRFKIDPEGTKDKIKQKFLSGFVPAGTLSSQMSAGES